MDTIDRDTSLARQHASDSRSRAGVRRFTARAAARRFTALAGAAN